MDPLHARERLREEIRDQVRAALADLERWGVSRATVRRYVGIEGPGAVARLWAEKRAEHGEGDDLDDYLQHCDQLKHRAIIDLMRAPRGRHFP